MDIYGVRFSLIGEYGSDEQQEKAKRINGAWRDRMIELTGRPPASCLYTEESYHVMVDQAKLAEIMVEFSERDFNEAVSVERVLKVFEDGPTPEEAIRPLLERMELAAQRCERMTESIVAGLDTRERAAGWNNVTTSPVPGLNLLHINCLKLLEDCCTDALQGQLADGWRLLAVCPQEARRPDYILGRCDPLFTGISALR